jgi:hypothetical protein
MFGAAHSAEAPMWVRERNPPFAAAALGVLFHPFILRAILLFGNILFSITI